MSEPRSRIVFKRWFRRCFLATVVLTAVAVAALTYLMYPVWRSYPQAGYSSAATEAEKNRQDLLYLSRLPEIDRSFSKERRRAFARAFDRLIARSGEFDRAKVTLEAARLTALADNGHTNILTQLSDQSFKSVPMRLGVFADGLYVVKALSDHQELIGAQLLAVNGRRIDAVTTAFRPYIGGPATLLRQHVPRLIISPELLMAAGLNGSPDGGEYRFRLANGAVIDRWLTAVDITPRLEDNSYWPVRDLSPVPTLSDVSGWSHVLDVAPLYLSRMDENYWQAYVDNGRVLFVQINRMRDQGRQRLKDYLNALLDLVERRRTRFVVVDLRYNRGGDYTLAADFARRLAEAVPADGRIFILTGGNTFSAAISIASRLKYFSGPRGVLIGEPMGDRGQFWGEGGRVILPNSKIAVSYATAFHDWEHGCRLEQITTCFLLNYLYPSAPGSLAPQIVVTPRFADYASGRDVVVDEVVKLERMDALARQ